MTVVMHLDESPVLALILEKVGEKAKHLTSVWQHQPLDKRHSGRLKFSALSTRFPLAPVDALAMWIADMDVVPPACAFEAINAAMNKSFGYQDTDIRSSVSRWYNKVHANIGGCLPPDNIVDVTSTIAAVNIALSTLCKREAQVLVLTPTYGPLIEAIIQNGMNAIFAPFEKALEKLTPDISACVLCHPNNPNGEMLSAQTQADIIDYCEKHDILLVVDEVHSEFGFVNGVPSSISWFGAEVGKAMSDTVIHINSTVKAFNLAGIPGASFAVIADGKKRRLFSDAINARHLAATPLSKVALNAVYEDGEHWLALVREAIGFNRQLVSEYLFYYGIKANVDMGQAGFFLWVNLVFPSSCNGQNPNVQNQSEQNQKHFNPATSYNECIARGVIGNDGSEFGAPGYARLNLACHPSVIERALNRLFFLNPA
ncbi:MAG: hypothetical protein AXW14_12210 [Alteromonas sp. Nap_26]|nr:MAG: hypothetical protein AXW14_12210 [Alteromonas sp. Nap_26]